MSNENKSIHEFDFSFICNYFKSFERQGPGSPEMTRKAVGFLENLPINPRIADLGCGTGGQTMVLANALESCITGMDVFPDFIEIFNRNASRYGLDNRVDGVVCSMDNLPFSDGELDVIWSEGAIYNIGFERGLNEWNRFLKPGGYIAVTEGTWFTPQRPAEIEKFWMDAYPEIDTIPVKIAQMEKAGYIPVACFILPEICWTEHFFAPQIPVQQTFLKEYEGDKVMEDFIANLQYEKVLYDIYKDYYGYVFYIGKKLK